MTAADGIRRLQRLATWAGGTAAITALPAGHLPTPWLLAGLLPAALLGLLVAARRRLRWVLALALAVQVLLGSVAYHWSGPLSQPAALAATLLPPLGFVVVRGHGGELALGLFLSFCLLLIGAILGGLHAVQVVAFVVAAAIALRCEARRAALQLCAAESDRDQVRLLGHAVSLAILCGATAMLTERALQLLPSPSVEPGAAAPAARTASGGVRQLGLSDSFDLGGGALPDLTGQLLIRVTATDRRPVPADLYLRTGFFQAADLEQWQVGRLQVQTMAAIDRELVLRPPIAGLPERRLEVLCEPATRDLLFVPPGATTLLGITTLRRDPRREWLRRTSPAAGDVFEVGYQDLAAVAQRWPIDTRWARQGLLSLPAGLDPRWLQPLLDEWRPGPSASPWQLAEAIGRGLQQRCTYTRQEPWGQHPSTLLNFLHGSRSGYCMHFASAAALLLRLGGVPCRIGVGLQGGEADSDHPGGRRYGSQNAHAWVELPVEGVGWVVFDPTPPANRGTLPDLPSTEASPENADATDDDAPGLLDGLVQLLREPWPALVLLILLLAVPALLPARQARRGPGLPGAARPARRLLERILRELRQRGCGRGVGEPLEVYLRRLQRRGLAAPDLGHAFAAYQQVRFGGAAFDAAREAALRAGLHAAQSVPAQPQA